MNYYISTISPELTKITIKTPMRLESYIYLYNIRRKTSRFFEEKNFIKKLVKVNIYCDASFHA